MRNIAFAVAAAALLSACASATTTQVSRNQVIISASAAPVCGRTGAARIASQMAAVETIRLGFQRFIIQDSRAADNARAVAVPPMGSMTTATVTGTGNFATGTANTQYYGGGVTYAGTFDSDLLVLMLNPGDPGFQNGVDARAQLGPDWQEIVQKGVRTCN